MWTLSLFTDSLVSRTFTSCLAEGSGAVLFADDFDSLVVPAPDSGYDLGNGVLW